MSIVPHADGVRLVSSRDERRDRPEALPPRERRLDSERALFPVDPVGGGTWVGVNGSGLAVALLNLNPGPGRRRDAGGRQPISRGHIVPLLLQYGRLAHALDQASAITPGDFEPFRAVMVQRRPGGAPLMAVATSDGDRLRIEQHALTTPVIFSSSSLGDSLVDGPRRQLFERLLAADPSGGLQAQARLHRHRWPGRPAVSVCMDRWDARTVSRTVVDLGFDRVALYYEPLADVRPVKVAC